MRRRARPIRQIDIDFLCLVTFGQRGLPDAMAERIALRREFARGAADALERADAARDRATSRRSSLHAESVEALSA